MIKFFRKIRQQLLTENKYIKYLLYAIGEIILVVIGILIALNINNTNEIRRQRIQELHYLKNIKTDLKLNVVHLDKYIEMRNSTINSARILVEHFEGKMIEDYEEFNGHTINIYTWRKFFQINNTFQELVNSGNFSLISNDTIKSALLNIETLYKVMKDEEAHFRYDSEKLLYDPYFEKIDTNPLVQNFTYQMSGGKAGKRIPLTIRNFQPMLDDIKQKNGFVMAEYEFTVMNVHLKEIKVMCNQLMQLIALELEK